MAEDSLQIKDSPFINILLLGETGVGKSTFINAIVNYLAYPDFETAEKVELMTVISSQFTVRDKFGEYCKVIVGPDDDQNECLEAGMSATQDVQSYLIPIRHNDAIVRLIDTPGIGDGRGIDQDNINCEKILSYVGQLEELHAICYLFKPVNSRVTVYFDYCMTQILSRLDKSASKNIIFIFTNTRGSDYTPGDTFPILKKVIQTIKSRPPYVDIPLNENIFCFDNEGFRYLSAVAQNIKFNKRIRLRNCESWNWSVEECDNLIRYIVGDSKQPPLKPHDIRNTNAINEARRLTVQLSRPLADITQLISDNVFTLERHKEDLEMSSNTIDEQKKKLYIPVIDLEVKQLEKPVTICASKKCAEIYTVRECNKWHYKQRCHDPCYLKNVPKELIGSPALLDCTAINYETGACWECECDFSAHMHVYYLTETVENKIIDKNVEQNINTKEMVLENVRKIIEDISKRKDELEKEHSMIIKTCAKFAHFLQNNAITPFNDSYKEYIEYLITREKSLGDYAKQSVINNLEKSLQEYQESKQFFVKALALQMRTGKGEMLITPQNIQENIQELYTLKHNGDKIRELYECQIKSRAQEHKIKDSLLSKAVKKTYNFLKSSINYQTDSDLQESSGQLQDQDSQYESASFSNDPWVILRRNSNETKTHAQKQGTNDNLLSKAVKKSYNLLKSTLGYTTNDKDNNTNKEQTITDQSPSLINKKSSIVDQGCSQVAEYQDNYSQHIPLNDELQSCSSDVSATANNQIDSEEQKNASQIQDKINDQSRPPTNEETSITSQTCSQDPPKDELQSSCQDVLEADSQVPVAVNDKIDSGQQKNADQFQDKIRDQSTVLTNEETCLTSETYSQEPKYQDNSSQHSPPNDESQNCSQTVLEPDPQVLVAVSGQTDNGQQKNGDQSQDKISDQSSHPTNEDLSPTSQDCSSQNSQYYTPCIIESQSPSQDNPVPDFHHPGNAEM